MLEIEDWADKNDDVYWVDGKPWLKESVFIFPLHMPHAIGDVNRVSVKKAIAESGALIARWVDKWDCEETGWWYTCCTDQEYDISIIGNSRGKRGIKKGLKNCTVKKIEVDEFVEKGYPIYKNALISYGQTYPSKEEYKTLMFKKSEFKGSEFWGAFHNEEMVAFSTCVVLDNSVTLGSTKSNPDFHKLSPNNALFYEITRHYLNERGMKYVSNGSRTLLHPTSINDFLIRMGFRKVFCKLNIELSPKAQLVYNSKIAKWGKLIGLNLILGERWKMIEGFNKLVEISKN